MNECPAKVTSCHVWTKVKTFIGQPKRQDFRMIKENIPALQENEILIEAICWSVEDYMRTFDVCPGSVMIGELVGSVIASRHSQYPLFSVVTCSGGWRTHVVVNPEMTPVKSAWNLEDHPVSLCLTTLGMPGLMAYFILTKFCRPEPHDTILINAAASSVGNVIAQMAKMMDCKVLAFSGSRDRCSWLNDLGLDNVLDASAISVEAAIKKICPEGIDCYIDCVGAEFTEQVIGNLSPNASVCVCGYNRAYSASSPYAHKPNPYKFVFMRHGKVVTASVTDFQEHFPEALNQLFDWIVKGKLKYKQTMYSGFEKLPEALADFHLGTRVGNSIVKSSLVRSLDTVVVEY